jgi:predicted enzyme related to lactoylglutathione lyase
MKRELSYSCIPVTDMEGSLNFYEKVLGLKVNYKADDWSELEFDNGTSLALRFQGAEENGNKYSGLGFRVENCEEASAELEAKGVQMIIRCQKRKANNLDSSDVFLSQFKDPCGNIIFLSQDI